MPAFNNMFSNQNKILRTPLVHVLTTGHLKEMEIHTKTNCYLVTLHFYASSESET